MRAWVGATAVAGGVLVVALADIVAGVALVLVGVGLLIPLDLFGGSGRDTEVAGDADTFSGAGGDGGAGP